MNNGERVLAEFWELFQKKILLESFFIKKQLKGYNPSELHCIQYIEENPNSNVKKLADAFRMTTGGVTKLTKKLIQRGVIEAYKSNGNKKEIYFRLTTSGKNIYIIHDRLHKDFSLRDAEIFDKITENEYASIFRFADIYNTHLENQLQAFGIDINSGLADRL